MPEYVSAYTTVFNLFGVELSWRDGLHFRFIHLEIPWLGIHKVWMRLIRR